MRPFGTTTTARRTATPSRRPLRTRIARRGICEVALRSIDRRPRRAVALWLLRSQASETPIPRPRRDPGLHRKRKHARELLWRPAPRSVSPARRGQCKSMALQQDRKDGDVRRQRE